MLLFLCVDIKFIDILCNNNRSIGGVTGLITEWVAFQMNLFLVRLTAHSYSLYDFLNTVFHDKILWLHRNKCLTHILESLKFCLLRYLLDFVLGLLDPCLPSLTSVTDYYYHLQFYGIYPIFLFVPNCIRYKNVNIITLFKLSLFHNIVRSQYCFVGGIAGRTSYLTAVSDSGHCRKRYLKPPWACCWHIFSTFHLVWSLYRSVCVRGSHVVVQSSSECVGMYTCTCAENAAYVQHSVRY